MLQPEHETSCQDIGCGWGNICRLSLSLACSPSQSTCNKKHHCRIWHSSTLSCTKCCIMLNICKSYWMQLFQLLVISSSVSKWFKLVKAHWPKTACTLETGLKWQWQILFSMLVYISTPSYISYMVYIIYTFPFSWRLFLFVRYMNVQWKKLRTTVS